MVCVSQGDKNDSDVKSVDIELEKYQAKSQCKGNPLEWWKSREGSMLTLAKVAKALLCIHYTSVPKQRYKSLVPSERVFSKAGYLINKQRSALKSKNAHMCPHFLEQKLQV